MHRVPSQIIQHVLFPDTAPTPAYRNVDTSIAAASAVRGVAAIRRAEIIHWLTVRGAFGATVHELMQHLGVADRNMVAPRCTELASEEYGCQIIDSTNRRTPRGKRTGQIVWCLPQYREINR
jgi:hypothetical protein